MIATVTDHHQQLLEGYARARGIALSQIGYSKVREDDKLVGYDPWSCSSSGRATLSSR